MAVADVDAKDADEKKDDSAAVDGEDLKRAEDDASADASDDSDSEDDEDEDDDEDESPMGEFRVQVMPNGNIRLVLADDDEEDDSDESDDDAGDGTEDEALNRSEDAADDMKDDDKKEDKDDSMDKSQQAVGARKIAVTQESLSKALDAVMQLGQAQDGEARIKTLMQKAQSETGLSKSEAKELFGGMKKSKKSSESLAERVEKSVREDEDLQKSQLSASQDQDVAAFLQAQSDSMVKGMTTMADAVDAMAQRDMASQMVLFKAIGQIGAAVKLIGERMQVIEAQPTRQPKSISVRPMEKSFAGAPSEPALDSSALIDTLTRMNMESRVQGRPGLSKGHRPLLDGIERAMNDQSLDAGLLEEIKAYRSQQVPA